MRAVCAAAGIDASGAVLVRRGGIAAYELRPPWIVARIARTIDYLPGAQTEVAVARWLESAGFPAVRLAGPVDQPIVAAGRVVTFWEQVSEGQSYGTVAELGSCFGDCTTLTLLLVPGAARTAAIRGSRAHVSAGLSFPPDDREFLLGRLEELRESYAHLELVLPPGPVHGDANVSSVLRSMWDGSPVLMDLDGFAVGPREWDLVLTAMYFERFGWHTEEEYREFVAGYGFDVMRWPGYTMLRDVRELIMLTWLAQNSWHLPEMTGGSRASVSRICARPNE